MADTSQIWLPIVTPFLDDGIDWLSFERLFERYIESPVAGFIVAGTTGESPALSKDETRALITAAAKTLRGRKPLWLGVSGNVTRSVVEAVRDANDWEIDGYLICTPYYNRPSQTGLLRHFEAVVEAAAKPVFLYNIPYRTGSNMANDTVLRLVNSHHIAGIKDSCGVPEQSFDLLSRKPANFRIFTGEDAFFYSAISHGAEGGILASAHILPEELAEVQSLIQAGRLPEARDLWRSLVDIVRLLFAEPNPAPIKYLLWKQGLLRSPELRLPLLSPSAELAAKLDILEIAGERAPASAVG